MKTKTINIYDFAELSDKAKQAAIDGLRDINVNYEWWDSIYEDAKTIGLQKEYEFLISDEAVIDTINANEYTFTETGAIENL